MENYTVLSNGVKIPKVGLGVFRAEEGDETKNAVLMAFEAGYRHIDTAMGYKNENSVGDAIKLSNIERSEIFITTKINNANVRARNAYNSIMESLEKLKSPYIDLLLIHWPVDGYKEAWKVMEDLYDKGIVKAIGVSNFQIHHLEDLMSDCKINPMVNQIESNPQFPNNEVTSYCLYRDIAVEAYSPLGGSKGGNLCDNEIIKNVADKYNVTTAQVMIRYQLQNNRIVIPKSITKSRIISNFDVYSFNLTHEDLREIALLDNGIRTGSDPDNFNF